MTPRDRAYEVVRKMKALYKREGCDWQREIEALVVELEAEATANAYKTVVKEATDAIEEYAGGLYPHGQRWEAARECKRLVQSLGTKSG